MAPIESKLMSKTPIIWSFLSIITTVGHDYDMLELLNELAELQILAACLDETEEFLVLDRNFEISDFFDMTRLNDFKV